MNVKKFLELAAKNGGGSYNINSGEINPTTGFMVSLPFEETHNDLKSVASFLTKQAEHLSKPDHFFGLWFDKVWYYDVSRNVPTLADAIRIGMKNDQLAIYDCEAGEVVPLPKRQTAGTATQQRAYIESVIRRMTEKEKVC